MLSQELIYIGLGFLAASLLAVLLSKILFRNAYKKAVKNLRGKVPLNQAELNAERDRLRAEFAVNLNKLEYKVAALHKAELELRVENMQAQEYKTQTVKSLNSSIKKATEWEQAHDTAMGDINILKNKLEIQHSMIEDMQVEQAQHQVDQREYEKARADYLLADGRYLDIKAERDETSSRLKDTAWQLDKASTERDLQKLELNEARKNNVIYDAKISEISTQLLFVGQELFAKKISLDLSEKAIDKYKNKLLVQKLAMRDASIKDKAVFAIKAKFNRTAELNLNSPNPSEISAELENSDKPSIKLPERTGRSSINTDSIAINQPKKPTLVHDNMRKNKYLRSNTGLRDRMNNMANSNGTGTDDWLLTNWLLTDYKSTDFIAIGCT